MPKNVIDLTIVPTWSKPAKDAAKAQGITAML